MRVDPAESSDHVYLDTNVFGELVCRAERLSGKYSFSPYDAMHVQAALDMKCRFFLSEDMQDGLRINNYLEIVNPFI